jgi:pyruvate dehydrogenase E2 component (dihydrolipoamide acetyltransferase)
MARYLPVSMSMQPVDEAPGGGTRPGARTPRLNDLRNTAPAISHLYLAATIDLDRAVTWLGEANTQRRPPERLVMAALFLRAVTLGLRDVPELNATVADGPRPPGAAVHLGVTVMRRDGAPVVPVLPDAERRSVDDLMKALRELVHRARTGRLREVDLGVPTFTVTNLGNLGVQSVFPSVVPPLVGAVGIGKVIEQPSAVDGTVVCSPVVTMTLAADHAVGSHRGARFLATIDRILQRPEAL